MTSQTIGSRRQVWNGTAKKTSGGLKKSDLMMNKHGRIVSRAKHNTAKKEMRLVKHGYGTKRGKFGFVKTGTKRRSMRGGLSGLSPGSSSWSGDKHVTFGGSGMRPMDTGTFDTPQWDAKNMTSGTSIPPNTSLYGGKRRKRRR
jgi:hypothetical protein